MKKELMTTKEVCEYFNKTVDTIRRWSNEGKLTRKYVGRSVFYETKEVLKLAK